MRKFAFDSFAITALNVLGQATSFLLFSLIAAQFGADARTDAFFLALSVPALFYGPVVNAIASVLIPQIADWRARVPEEIGLRLGTLVVWVLLFSLATMGLVAVAAQGVLELAAPSLPPAARAQAGEHMVLLLPVIAAQTVAGVLSAAYNAFGRFPVPAASVVARQMITLALVAGLRPALGIDALPAAFVGGSLLQVALLGARWRTLGVRLSFGLRPAPDLVRSLRLTLPLVVGSAALQLGFAATRFLAAGLPAGSVSVLDYAGRISAALLELLSGGAFLVAFVDWSRAVVAGERERLRRQVCQAAQVLLFVLVPLVAVLLAVRRPLIEVLLERGSFDAAASARTAAAMAVFFLWIPVEALGQMYVRLMLAWQETGRIGVLATTRLAVVLAGAFALVGPWGVQGLACAELLGSAVITGAVVARVARRLEENPLPWLGRALLRLAPCAAASFAVATAIAGADWPAIVRLPVAGVAGAAAALGVARVLRFEPLEWIRAGLLGAPRGAGEA